MGQQGAWRGHVLVLCCLLLAGVVEMVQAQGAMSGPAPAPSLELAEDSCVGVFLQYEVTQTPTRIRPYSDDVSKQPYSFESKVTLTNLGYEELENWELSIDFQWREVIAEASGVMFLTGLAPPGLEVGNDTRIIGVDQPALLTTIDTADNLGLISTNFTLLGTEFGVNDKGIPLPANMTLVNDGYKCGGPSASAPLSQMWVCCTENVTEINSTNTRDASQFSVRKSGDVTITYDVMGAYTGSYLAQVSIVMEDPIGRIDNWNLSWTWAYGEFIQKMSGAQILGPNDQDKCVYGPAATQYGNDATVDFQNVMSCSPNPVIVDLTPDKRNDTTVGIPFCCRNGTVLPDLIDPDQSKSNFQLLVKKLPPHMAQDDISPPLDWNIAEGYECTQPIQVSPTEFYPEELHSSSAVASWQVVCNKSVTPVKSCCVSFSAYFNDSLIPCPTCSCGCSSNTLPWNGETCNPHIDAMLLPYNGVLLPPSNRTALGRQLARLDHYQVPQPLPCPDNCGVSMNWHVYSDYRNGWSARMTIFNWDTLPISQWSAAVQMPAAMAGFQDVYSFNGSKVPDMNNTLFMQGHDKYDNDYLLGKDSMDNPGKLQSILSFDKRRTPDINVVAGDGYPSKVSFNGEECSIPAMVPAGDGWRLLLSTFQFAVVFFATVFLTW